MADSYSVAEVIRGQLQRGAPAETVRDIETITAEIIRLKQDAGSAILAIGKRLIEAKTMLSEGEWLTWLSDQVDFSPRTAQRFMRLAKEWTDATALSHLGATKALTLLALPPEEREAFLSETHLVDGQEKSVVDMTSRELEKAIRERDEAQKAAEAARAEARTAEESRAKMETDMKALKKIHLSAVSEAEEAVAALLAAQKELKELRERPVDVAVETVVDREAVERARAEAVAEMQAKVDQAERARKEAEKTLLTAEKERKDRDQGDVSLLDQILSVHSQAYSLISQLHGLLMKSRSRNHAPDAAQAERSLLDLSVYARKCIE